MAFLLGCENVHLEYPTKVIFESLSLGIDDGDAIGVVGKNGDGKSSLLRLFDGTIEPDEGACSAHAWRACCYACSKRCS